VVAVGSLHGLWLELPVDVSGPEDLPSRFTSFFGQPWNEVMLGRELPFAYHKDWSAFIAVSGMKEGPGWPFWELTGFHLKPEDAVYRIMVG